MRRRKRNTSSRNGIDVIMKVHYNDSDNNNNNNNNNNNKCHGADGWFHPLCYFASLLSPSLSPHRSFSDNMICSGRSRSSWNRRRNIGCFPSTSTYRTMRMMLWSYLFVLSFLWMGNVVSALGEGEGTSVEKQEELLCEPWSLTVPSYFDDELVGKDNDFYDYNVDFAMEEGLDTSNSGSGTGSTLSNAQAETSSSSSSSSTTTNEATTTTTEMATTKAKTLPQRKKIVIAHRGASFHVPEHTIISYTIALELGCDYIEPDLVVTQDGHLVAVHSVDLNITTDIEQVASQKWNRTPWFSPYANRSGYWSYNFTLDQIQQLRVKQRLPDVRSTDYDGKFQIPHLLQIQRLLMDWKLKRLPLLQNTTIDQSTSLSGTTPTTTTSQSESPTLSSLSSMITQPGLFAELKHTEWIRQDTGMDIVQIFIQTVQGHPDLFPDMLTCHPKKYHHYQIPSLVIQSFDTPVLKQFHQLWSETMNTTLSNTATSQPNTILSLPPPPLVLLVSRDACFAEDFWFTFGREDRDIIQGIGPDKKCLLPDSTTTKEESLAFMERVKEFDLIVYPWTERPELEYVSQNLNLHNMFEEIQYLFCNVNVDGVFVEMVSTAVLASNLPCPLEQSSKYLDVPTDTQQQLPSQYQPDTTDTDTDTSYNYQDHDAPNADHNNVPSPKTMCYESEHQANLYVGIASFVMGIFLTAMTSLWLNTRNYRGAARIRRPRRELRVPTTEEHEEQQPSTGATTTTNGHDLEML